MLGSQVRTRDLLRRTAHRPDAAQLFSMESWGGATYDVTLRFLKEDPMAAAGEFAEAMPNIPQQMLLRGHARSATRPTRSR